MVKSRAPALLPASRLALGLLLVAAGCQTPVPVEVYDSFHTAQELRISPPSNVAVLPVENGTGDPAVDRHLSVMRRELMGSLISRSYAPPRANWVDASLGDLARAGRPAATSVLDPAWLKSAAAAVAEEAVLAVRIDNWDESKLLVTRRVHFELRAHLVDKAGNRLWYGTLSGNVKAGGAGAAPREPEYMVRSCIELAVQELLLRLPSRRG